MQLALFLAVCLLFQPLLLYLFLSPRQCHLSLTLALLNPVLALPPPPFDLSTQVVESSEGSSTPYLVPLLPPLAHETVLLPRSTFRSLALETSLYSFLLLDTLALNDDLRPPPVQQVAVEDFEGQEESRQPDARRVCSLPRRSPRQRTQPRDFVDRPTRLCDDR